MHASRSPGFLAYVLLIPGLLAQDARRVIPYPIPVERGWAAAVAAGTRTEDGSPGEKSWSNDASYVIDIDLDPATAECKGHSVMTYKNRSPRRLPSLKVHLRQNIHRREAVRNTPVEITGGMTVTEVLVRKGGGEASPAGKSVDGTVMTVRVAVDPGEEVTLDLTWSFKVPRAGQAPRMGHDNHHVYFLGYWYPQFAVAEDVAGWVADPYLGGGEFYMGNADYEVRLTLPAGWIVRATGELVNPDEVLSDTTRARLGTVTPEGGVVPIVTKEDLGGGNVTREGTDGRLTWKFKASNVRDFAISASDIYVWDAVAAVVKNQKGPGQDGITLCHAVYRKSAGGWKKGAAFLKHTIEFMSGWLHPYPWPAMTAAEGIVGGGMEYPMMTIVGGMSFEPILHMIIVHETIHMWFPMIVGSNETRWAWMDEGFTDFCTDLTLQDAKPDEDKRAERLREYRGGAAQRDEVECMRHADLYPRDRPMAYGFASYTKTAAVLHQLRAHLGKERFDRALRTYVDRWARRHPYPRDLFSTFNAVAGENLDAYFRTWFYETWVLDQAIVEIRSEADRSVVVVEEKELAMNATVVEATFEDGHTERKAITVEEWLSGGRRRELVFPKGVTKATIDPDHATLDLDPKNNTKHAQ